MASAVLLATPRNDTQCGEAAGQERDARRLRDGRRGGTGQCGRRADGQNGKGAEEFLHHDLGKNVSTGTRLDG